MRGCCQSLQSKHNKFSTSVINLRMAHGGMEHLDMRDMCCPICLEVYEKPMKLPCEHTMCYKCLSAYLSHSSAKCPLCSADFDPKMTTRNTQLEHLLSKCESSCTGCGKRMKTKRLRKHLNSCSANKPDLTFKPVATTSQPVPSNVPNRSTFSCPYCNLSNLDVNDLRDHCNQKHKNSNQAVVCPICSAMPWGDKGMKSGNFLAHLNLRHKFEYDTYVDYQQDDDAMLRAAIAASLSEN